MAAGKPVVVYDCDGAKEVCMDGENGFLIPMGDLKVLQSRLLSLADQVQLRHKMGECGRTLVRRQFPIEKMVKSISALYFRLFNRVDKADKRAHLTN